MGFFDKLKNGLSKTKNSFDEKINNVFSNFRKVDEELLDELEEALIMSDVGVETSTKIISNLRNRIKKEKIENEEDVRNALREEIVNILNEVDNGLKLNTHPSVILVVGVNGVGKTTSIGKIANRLKKDGKKVVVAAADTFRAAAVEQLEIWANRAGCDIVKREEGTDPAAVVYDAVKIAKEKQADVLICDTAGRLHNKKYLMDELVKIKKVIDKENLLNIFREENPDVVDIKDMFKSIRNSSNNIIEVEATLIKNYNGIKEEFEQTYYFYKNTNFISLNNYEEEKYD